MKRIFVAFSIVLLTSTVAAAATREVGSGQAFTTIQACINASAAGDICNVHAGTYSEQLTLRSGTSSARIVIKNNGSEVVTVQSAATPVVNISGASYWTLDGININYTGTAANPVGIFNDNCNFSNAGIIQNLTVTMSSGGSGGDGAGIRALCTDGMLISNTKVAIRATASNSYLNGMSLLISSRLTIDDCEVYGNASETTGRLQDGILVSGTNITITDCYVHDGWAYDSHPDGIVIQGDGDRNGNRTANFIIERNTVKNFSQGLFLDAIHNSIDGTNRIANNLFVEGAEFRYGGQANKMNGVILSGENVFGGSDWTIRADFYNNVIDTRQQQFGVGRQISGSVVNVRNNVFLNPGYTAIDITNTVGVSMNYNYYSQGNSQPIRWGGAVYSLSQYKGAGLGEANSVAGTAGLTSDYRVSSTSDVRNRGVNLYTSFTTDKSGATRPSSGAWDMGAYQYSGATSGPLPAPPSGLRITSE